MVPDNSPKIPPLTYIDDILSMSKCGIEAVESNTFLTTKIEMKRMNFNVGGESKPSKCQKMHVGKRSEKCQELYTNRKKLEDVV